MRKEYVLSDSRFRENGFPCLLMNGFLMNLMVGQYLPLLRRVMSCGSQFWKRLMQKLHGSYEALEGGLVQYALIDLTGGAGEEIDMRSV